MKFTTVSGSIYEVNTDSKQVRRLNGVKDPTPRQGPDGQWRAYSDITPVKVGSSVAIFWGTETALLAETEQHLKEMGGGMAAPITTTSMVVNVEP
jgi:hypothetical protein